MGDVAHSDVATTTGPMTERVLPYAEWARLVGTDAEGIWRYALDPARTTVVVVEDHQGVIAHLALLDVLHAEFFWIAPAHRYNPTQRLIFESAYRV